MTIKEILKNNDGIEWVTLLSINNATTFYCKNVKYLTERQLNTKVKKYAIENGNHMIFSNK